ncbi:MAG TPA: hypothetical protein VHU82_05940 [Vicinamibacterales bacterium]|jgi:hypothetical protein|nr:hypothetical protein [Vicinamibacterales bacterium]
MSRRRLAGLRLPLVLALLLPAAPGSAQSSPSSGSTALVLAGNRVYAELSFVRPGGSIHKALAFVDMGSPRASVSSSLFSDLQLDKQASLTFRVGLMPVTIPVSQVTLDRDEPHSVGSTLLVEAVLPASVLQAYQVVLDYRARSLTLARPGVLTPSGIPIPFHINQETGLIAVDASIAGASYPLTIDSGSAYTWLRQSAAAEWISTHPGWKRGVGAVGASNMRMAGDGAESSGVLLRLPEVRIGPLTLKDVGALGAGPSEGPIANVDLFDWYSTKNTVPVIGWLGGNVLKAFRLTIDYPGRVIYWLEQAGLDADDMTQVGLTLQTLRDDYIVDAVATKSGRPTVEGVQRGDRLVSINGRQTRHAPRGAVYAALHGKAGDLRTLVLERGGRRIKVIARVTAF